MKFLCSGCGACCMNVIGSNLPHDENGVCDHLDRKTKKCSIYETRPEECRVDRLYEKHFKSKWYHRALGERKNSDGVEITRKEFYKATAKACNILIDKEGLDDSFKLDLSEYDE
tara:strand:+ start:198 stop:539 length:342 start_codon:yes stop_codon:yes gene_type:complete